MDIIQQLLKEKVIDKHQAIDLKTKVQTSRKTPEEIILKENIMPENALFQMKAKMLKIPFRKKIPSEISQKVLEKIAKESARYYKIIPLEMVKGILYVGMVYPENMEAQEALKFLVRQQKIDYKIVLITLSDFKKCVENYQMPKQEMEKALKRIETEIKTKKKKEATPGGVRFETIVEEAPVIKMVAVILRQAVEGKASDIHIEPTRDNLRVRYRLDGILHSSLLLPRGIQPAIVTRVKVLANLKIDETRIPQDGRFSADINGKMIDFRVSTFPTTLGEKVAIRVLDPAEGLKSLKDLGFNPWNFQIVNQAIKRPYGMILVTGPTGSGKSTTLYAILRTLNKEGVNIVTLEDPVEYFISGVNQSQVKPEINYTFARGLRQILRQDPDIIMIGEIRDRETAALAVHAALTGHLVLSTLHTNNALDAIPRLIDMGIEPFLIPPSLLLVISQELVRVLCPYCKKSNTANKKVRNFITKGIQSLPPNVKKKILPVKNDWRIFEAQGCQKCKFKGYSGRIGLFEILQMTPNLAKIITEGIQRDKLVAEAKSQGMIFMEEDGILKVLQGVTTVEEVVRVTTDKQ